MDIKKLKAREVIGHCNDLKLAKRVEDLKKIDRVEYIYLSPEETARRHFRVQTSKGSDCAVALPRNAHLGDGSIIILTEERAVIVSLKKRQWLRLRPLDQNAALELGYHCGNLHWKVEFKGSELKVALDGDEDNYLDRLSSFLGDGRVQRITE
tara:strand:+ start:22299 stop:22757 length:459 start_codon:yes stop_codon:yes gene_type:complete